MDCLESRIEELVDEVRTWTDSGVQRPPLFFEAFMILTIDLASHLLLEKASQLHGVRDFRREHLDVLI